MQCPHCGYVLSAFDKTCPRCGKLPTTKPTPVNVPATPPAHSPVPTNAVPGVPPATPNGLPPVPPVPQSTPSPSDVSNAFGSFLSTLQSFLVGKKLILPFCLMVVLIGGGLAYKTLHKGSTYYADKLHLTPLPPPAQLAPLPEKLDAQTEELVARVERAGTISQIDQALAEIHDAQKVIPLFFGASGKFSAAETQKGLAAGLEALTWLEQAGQIKREQLTNNDMNDSTGEVHQHIQMFRQCWVNSPILSQNAKY